MEIVDRGTATFQVAQLTRHFLGEEEARERGAEYIRQEFPKADAYGPVLVVFLSADAHGAFYEVTGFVFSVEEANSR